MVFTNMSEFSQKVLRTFTQKWYWKYTVRVSSKEKWVTSGLA